MSFWHPDKLTWAHIIIFPIIVGLGGLLGVFIAWAAFWALNP